MYTPVFVFHFIRMWIMALHATHSFLNTHGRFIILGTNSMDTIGCMALHT